MTATLDGPVEAVMDPTMPEALGPNGLEVFEAAQVGRSFTPSELSLLREAAKCFDMAALARAQVRKEGATTLDRYRGARPHPACKMAVAFVEQGRKLLRQLRVAG